MFNPMKNQAMKVTFIKDVPQNETETEKPDVDFATIEEIARRSILDLTKLGVASVGTLMTLHTALNIIEELATRAK